jgi:hypothetical protein
MLDTKVSHLVLIEDEAVVLVEMATANIDAGWSLERAYLWLLSKGSAGWMAAARLPGQIEHERREARRQVAHLNRVFASMALRRAKRAMYRAQLRRAEAARLARLPHRRRPEAARAPRQAHVSRRSDRTNAPPEEDCDPHSEGDLASHLARLERRVDALAGLHDELVADLAWSGVLR